MQLKSYTTYLKNGVSSVQTLVFNVGRMSNIRAYAANTDYTEFTYEYYRGSKDTYVITTLPATVLTDTANYDTNVKVSGITVDDIDGATDGGSPTIEVNGISLVFVDPSDSNKCYAMYDDNTVGLKRYHLSSTAANLVTTANAQAETFDTVTLTDGFALPFQDESGTPGAATINKISGKAKIASGGNALVITNSKVTADSVVLVNLEQIDATLTEILTVIPSAGSFSINGNANATADVLISFVVFN